MDKIQIRVENVKCGGCVTNITSSLKEFDGIDDVAVEIDSGLVTLNDNQINLQAIENKLIELGYPPVADK